LIRRFSVTLTLVLAVLVIVPFAIHAAEPGVVAVGGQYRVMGNLSNFNFHQTDIGASEPTQHFFNVRFRTWLDVNPTEKVSGNLQLEMGHILWGVGGDFPKTYGGDKIGLEIRRAYLTYRANVGQFRVGIQDWSDSFGHILADSDWDFNLGGIHFSRTLEEARDAVLGVGFFRVVEGDASDESDNTDLFVADFDVPVGEGASVGASAYALRDDGGYSFSHSEMDYCSAREYWIGGRGKALVGEATVDGFVILNWGNREEPDWDHTGFAYQLRRVSYPRSDVRRRRGCGKLLELHGCEQPPRAVGCKRPGHFSAESWLGADNHPGTVVFSAKR
jgi:hypothetical protein